VAPASLRVEQRRGAGLARCRPLVFWNGLPWDLGGHRPTAADKDRGATYLKRLAADAVVVAIEVVRVWR
jgi:hypothetical protein